MGSVSTPLRHCEKPLSHTDEIGPLAVCSMFLYPSVTYTSSKSVLTVLAQWQKWATLGDDFSTKVLKDLTLTT